MADNQPSFTFTGELTEEQQALWGLFLYDTVQQTASLANNLTKKLYIYMKKIKDETRTCTDEDGYELAAIVGDYIKNGLKLDRAIANYIRNNNLPITFKSPIFGLVKSALSNLNTQPVNNDTPNSHEASISGETNNEVKLGNDSPPITDTLPSTSTFDTEEDGRDCVIQKETESESKQPEK